MNHDRQSRVLAALRQLVEQDPDRRAFAAEEVGAGTDMDPLEAETVLEELVDSGGVETVTAYWPDQGGSGLPPGGRLYTLPAADQRDQEHG